jgi:hypothetical protein
MEAAAMLEERFRQAIAAAPHVTTESNMSVAIAGYRERVGRVYAGTPARCTRLSASLSSSWSSTSSSSASATTSTAKITDPEGGAHRLLLLLHQEEGPQTSSSNKAWSCLTNQTTNPSTVFQYPADAEYHYYEIRNATAEWAQHAGHTMHTHSGYSGPWIENHWISTFETLYDNDQQQHLCLSDVFGPFIPLFVPWVDTWVRSDRRHRRNYMDLLRRLSGVLRPDVPYITVSQNDEGIGGGGRRNKDAELDLMHRFPNLLVLSAGGYGHVPIPLLKQEEARNNERDPQHRTYGISFVGNLKTDQLGLRRGMHATMEERYGDDGGDDNKENTGTANSNNSQNTRFLYRYAMGQEWRDIMADSKFSLVPRGYGRSAFHLVETIQMGLIPIYLYKKIPWIPYSDLLQNYIFMAPFDQLEDLVQNLTRITMEELRVREHSMLALREHFTVAGVMTQILAFMTSGGGDLRCQPLPYDVRTDG